MVTNYLWGGGVRATPLGVGVEALRLTGVALGSFPRGVGVTAPFLPDRLLDEPRR